ncbi:MAG: metal ABC transporter substrate-binding protein [Acidimicrobiia bacterium]|nr:metal ABC transporter substrate-binding protein [Acidimicrobiia bacterium]
MHKFSFLLTAIAITATACASEPPQQADTLRIVTTTSIVGDVVSNVVGDQAEVSVLIPNGGDPHEFQLSAKQVAELRAADLVVAIGLGLEPSIATALHDAATDGTPVLELGPSVDPRSFPDGSPDPHIWFDPVRMIAATRLIADALEALDSTTDWSANAETYAEQLSETDHQITTLIGGLGADQRKLVTNHASIGYFADRYGLEVVGVIIPGGSTLANPSSAELAELIRIIDELSVPAIFVETTESDELALAIAGETAQPVTIVELFTESLAPEGEPGDSLTSLLLVDAERVVAGLAIPAEADS